MLNKDHSLGRQMMRKKLGFTAFFLSCWLGMPSLGVAAQLPTGGEIQSGSGSISQSGKEMHIEQTTHNLDINWQGFSVGEGHTVQFNQPSTEATAFNHVVGSDVSKIQGAIEANGQVFLMNPNGVIFSSTAQVNVGSLVTSTLDLVNQGEEGFSLDGESLASIVQEGTVDVRDGGLVALVAAKVVNEGTINAPHGDVLLAAGKRVTLDLGSRVKAQIDEGALDALVEQKGAIHAGGGYILLTAKALGDLMPTVVNHTGTSEAQTLTVDDQGTILLLAENGTLSASGTLDASAPTVGDGGFVETSGSLLDLANDLYVTTKAENGQTGSFLIDPTNIEIIDGLGGSRIKAGIGYVLTTSQVKAGLIEFSLADNNVRVVTQPSGDEEGNITVKAPISWDTNHRFALEAHGDIYIESDIEGTGDTAEFVLTMGEGHDYHIRGGKVTLSGANAKFYTGTSVTNVTNTILPPELLEDPDSNLTEYTLIHTKADLENLATSVDTPLYIAVAEDLDLSGEGENAYKPTGQGGYTGAFVGTFAGLGHVMKNPTPTSSREIEGGSGNYVNGIFGYIGGSSTPTLIRDMGIEGGGFSANNNRGAIAAIARNNTKILNCYNTAHLGPYRYVSAGLIGYVGKNQEVDGGLVIEKCFNTGTMEGYYGAGGLLGSVSQVDVTIIDSFNAGIVEARSGYSAGGLIKSFSGGSLTITNCYSIGEIGEDGAKAGALIGTASVESWDVDNFYYIDGSLPLVGSYGEESSQLDGEGNTYAAYSIEDLRKQSTYTGFDFTNSWRIADGLSTPMLRGMKPRYTVKAKDASVTFSGNTHSSSVQTESISNASGIFEDLADALSGDLVVQGTAADAVNVGEYTIDPAGITSDYYRISFESGTLTINPKQLSVSGTAVSNKVYDGTATADLSEDGSLSGLAGEEFLQLTATAGDFEDANVGEEKPVTVSYEIADGVGDGAGLASNYTAPSEKEFHASITARPLTIENSIPKNKTYDGNTDAEVEAGQLSGFVGLETVGVSASGTFDNKNADVDKLVTIAYELSNGENGGLASNYSLESGEGKANIDPKEVTISTADVDTKVYDGSRIASISNAKLTGLVEGESLTVVATGQYDTPHAGTDKTVSVIYDIADSETGLASNYFLETSSQSLTGDIDRRPLSMQGSIAKDKTYDGLTGATVLPGHLVNLAGSETLKISEDITASFENANAGEDKKVTASYSLLDGTGDNGGLASNYSLASQMLYATINPKPLSIETLTAKDKSYDGSSEATVLQGFFQVMRTTSLLIW